MTQRPLPPFRQAAPRGSSPRRTGVRACGRAGMRAEEPCGVGRGGRVGGWATAEGVCLCVLCVPVRACARARACACRMGSGEEAGATRLSPCRMRIREAVQEGEAIDEAVPAIEGTGGVVFRCVIAQQGRAAWARGGRVG